MSELEARNGGISNMVDTNDRDTRRFDRVMSKAREYETNIANRQSVLPRRQGESAEAYGERYMRTRFNRKYSQSTYMKGRTNG